MRWLAALALVACSSSKEPSGDRGSSGSAGDHTTGTLTIDGTAVAMTGCRAGSETSVFVEVATPRGSLRFQDRTLSWKTERGLERLRCEPLPTNKAIWGGGARADRTAYFVGELKFTCAGAIGTIDGDLDLECGHITYEERALLHTNRQQHEPSGSP